MEEASLTILGSSSATPSIDRFSTAQLLQLRGRTFLIDCGEGTQIQLRRYKLSMHRIDAVFISHLHGDHFFGLPGLLSSMHLLNREKPLTVYAPPGTETIIQGMLKAQGTWLNYPLHFTEVQAHEPALILDDEALEVWSLPLRHRVPCTGFYFREKPRLPHLRKSAVERYQIPVYQRARIKEGEGFTLDDGTVIPHEELTSPPDPTVSYAFISDTKPVMEWTQKVRGSNIIYHEATFLDRDKKLAEKTGHSTARQAGIFAREARVDALILGHVSPRYKDFSLLQKEAAEEFSRVFMACDGAVFNLRSLEPFPPKK